MGDVPESFQSSPTFESPAFDGVAITPSDSDDLVETVRCLYVGVTGNLHILTVMGTELTFVNVPVGFFPVGVKKVFATGTTATDMIGLF